MCTAPACGALADHVEIDHITEYQHGGKTVRINLHCLCKRHHRAKHAGGWTVVRHPDGTETWTSAHGKRYRTEPTAYPGRTRGSAADDEPSDDDDDDLALPPPWELPGPEPGPQTRTPDGGADDCPF